MDKTFAKYVDNSTAHRSSREGLAMRVLAHPRLADDLITLALDIHNKNHFKACWILEIVLEKNLQLIVPRLDDFCDNLLNWKNDSAIRPVSKICLFCATHHLKKDKGFLSEKQLLQITESCFHWVISEEKVAAKAYSIRTLYLTGKLLDWVYPELIPVLQHGFPDHSAAYRTVAREVLAKINNFL